MAGGWVSRCPTSHEFITLVKILTVTWDCQTRHSPGTLVASGAHEQKTAENGTDLHRRKNF
ncbi:MAG: hypothetical protein BAJALOKI3v1_1340001 [Promethearchaeota archaeon]|nr:MAG: hypothetical protein BAJALOKI3v1_1340001 [Candidatus Lokiarchaeota archaeon]